MFEFVRFRSTSTGKSAFSVVLFLVAVACGSGDSAVSSVTSAPTAGTAAQPVASSSPVGSTTSPDTTDATDADASCELLTSNEDIGVLAGPWVYGDIIVTLEPGADSEVLDGVTANVGDIMLWLTFLEGEGDEPGVAYLLVSEDARERNLEDIEGVASVQLVDFEAVISAAQGFTTSQEPESLSADTASGLAELADAGSALATVRSDGPRLVAALYAEGARDLFPTRELVAEAIAACRE